MRYEGYGPSGMAVMVDALTDNRNRTAADLRLAFSKNGGNLGNRRVSYLFEHRSDVQIVASADDEERLVESLTELDAEGYELTSAGATVHGAFNRLEALQDGLGSRADGERMGPCLDTAHQPAHR